LTRGTARVKFQNEVKSLLIAKEALRGGNAGQGVRAEAWEISRSLREKLVRGGAGKSYQINVTASRNVLALHEDEGDEDPNGDN